MEVKIVLGHAFGDEGKGVTTQWLCKQALAEGKRPCVVRFSGGPQAGHTIFNEGVEHICASFGSGALLGVPTAYTSDVYIDPICIKKEYDVLCEKGIKPVLMLSGGHKVITPYDVAAGRRNEKVLSDGTCGKGLFATFDRYDKGWFARLNLWDYLKHLSYAADCYNFKRDEKCDKMFKEALDWLRNTNNLHPALTDYDVLIFEGTQGLLLDMDCGYYPHVTPSRVGLNGIPEGYLRGAELYLVTRSYTTRHGNGYEPTLPNKYDLSSKHETNIANEYQGEFKTGALEISLLNNAYQRHCIDNYVRKYDIKTNLVVTHVDVPMQCGIFWCRDDKGAAEVYPIDRKEDVCRIIQSYLCYRPNRVFYNDSVESNLQEVI